MMKKLMLLGMAAAALEAQVGAGCYATGWYVCHPAVNTTTACGYPYTETAGLVQRAANVGESPGYDSVGYYDTTCDYTWHSYDCYGVAHSGPGSDGPIQASYARGNRCNW